MQLKNTLWAGLALLSAALWAPQANAIPAFARQVGMACSACHYQHFPVLNSFGRAFKEGGYTMIGSEEKIEDTTAPGVSIPAVLNAAFVGYISDTKTNGPATTNFATTGQKSTNDNSLQIPLQISLFLAGRGGEHIGFESEINLNPAGGTLPNGSPAGSAGLIRLKVMSVYDVGNVKAGIVPFSTGLGAADSFEVLNTGAVAVHAFNQSDMKSISAQQYIGTATNASGVAFIASNDNFFANFAKWGANNGGGASGSPSSNYLRAAWTTGLIPGFDSAIGFQAWNGTSGNNPGVLTGPATSPWVDTKASAIDAQMMGDMAGMPLLLVASYANAPASSTVNNANLFNGNGLSRKSLNFGAELGVIPGVATVQLGLRSAKSGGADAVTGANMSDNAIMIGATYSIALNVRLEATFSKYSGDTYNAANTAAAITAGTYMGNQLTMIDLAFGF